MEPTGGPWAGRDDRPNYELLRRLGWTLGTVSGSYCVAWRGRDQGVFRWRDGAWHRVEGVGSRAA